MLFIDKVHTLIGAEAAEDAIDAANILKRLLQEVNCSVLELQHSMNIENILRKTQLWKDDSSQSKCLNQLWMILF